MARRTKYTAEEALGMVLGDLDDNYDETCYPTPDMKKLKCIVAFHNMCIFADFASASSNFLG